jgi:hypothetical protein
LEDTRKLFQASIEANDKALVLADRNMTSKIHEMNNLQSRMEARDQNFVDVKFYRAEHKALEAKIEFLIGENNIQRGRHSWSSILAIAAVIIALATAILDYAVHH